MRAWTFEHINNVLKVAAERKCQEAQACLQGIVGAVSGDNIYWTAQSN